MKCTGKELLGSIVGYQRFNDVQSMTKRREMTYEHCHCGALKGAEKSYTIILASPQQVHGKGSHRS